MTLPARSFLRICGATALALGSVHLAQACSVCAVGKEEARAAYYATTALMSLVPLGMIGGVVYFISRKNR